MPKQVGSKAEINVVHRVKKENVAVLIFDLSNVKMAARETKLLPLLFGRTEDVVKDCKKFMIYINIYI